MGYGGLICHGQRGSGFISEYDGILYFVLFFCLYYVLTFWAYGILCILGSYPTWHYCLLSKCKPKPAKYPAYYPNIIRQENNTYPIVWQLASYWTRWSTSRATWLILSIYRRRYKPNFFLRWVFLPPSDEVRTEICFLSFWWLWFLDLGFFTLFHIYFICFLSICLFISFAVSTASVSSTSDRLAAILPLSPSYPRILACLTPSAPQKE